MNNPQAISTLVGIAATLLPAPAGHAADINVPGERPSIQAAIDAANPGDVVIVDQGEYFENINFNGKAITVRSTDPNDPGVVLNTIINGGGSGTVVTCASGEGADTILSGFVITGGNTVDGGGGMLVAGSSPTVTNCSFIGNTGAGGGMFNAENSSPTVINCSFIGNTATGSGGGMHNEFSSPTVANCAFNGNSAGSGGGMFNFGDTSPTVTNCSFTGNTASDFGGGMRNEFSSPTVTNSSFNANSATSGGGMSNLSGSTTVAGTGFCANTPDQITGIFTDAGGNSLLYCAPAIPKPDPCPTDVNDDGVTNVLDLIDLLLAFGTTCP